MSCMTRGVTVVRRPVANRSSWTQVFALSLFVVVPAVIMALSAYSAARGSHPTDDELTARFLSHEADFHALVQMFDLDRRRLPLADGPCDLAELVAAGAARKGDYATLLAKIGAPTSATFLDRAMSFCPWPSQASIPRTPRSLTCT